MQLVCTLLHSGDLGEPIIEILELLVVAAEKKKVRGTPYVFFDPDRAQMFPYLRPGGSYAAGLYLAALRGLRRTYGRNIGAFGGGRRKKKKGKGYPLRLF